MRLSVFFLLIYIFVLSACTNVQKHTENTEIINESNQNSMASMNFDETDTYMIYFTIGSRLKSLSNISGINEPVIIVNNKAITRKDIEIERIYIDYLDSITLKDRIELLIKNTVLTIEANNLGIEPSQENIMAYMENIKKAMNYDDGQISGYMDGMGITEEEHIASNENIAYNMYQREALWQKVKQPLENKIVKEAKKRNVSLTEVEREYYEKYVDDLVENADIKFLDNEIKKLLYDEVSNSN